MKEAVLYELEREGREKSRDFERRRGKLSIAVSRMAASLRCLIRSNNCYSMCAGSFPIDTCFQKQN